MPNPFPNHECRRVESGANDSFRYSAGQIEQPRSIEAMQMRLAAFLAAALSLGAAAAPADGPPPFPEFSAKRVKPPATGTARRITVQIAPLPPEPKALAPVPAAVPAPLSPASDWFWSRVRADMEDAGPARLIDALAAVEAAGSHLALRLRDVQAVAAAQGREILRTTVGTRVSPALVVAVIAVESGGRADAVSRAGAAGLMQLMPATAARFGVADRFDAAQSIRGGVAYLDWLMEEFRGDPVLVLAAYNAGEGAVRAHSGVPPFAETRDYVPKVLAAFRLARGLCLTPPQLVSDGCVFAGMN